MNLSRSDILIYRKKYDILSRKLSDYLQEKQIRDWLNNKDYLNRKYFLKICMWKSKRPKKLYEDELNSEERIINITKLSFHSKDEYFKIKVLQLLKGVSWPVASTILHFMQPSRYMIMDFRAIWSLGWQQPKSYDFYFWTRYTKTVRLISKKNKVSLRTLDKALWFYSKENQK